jgi:hypothetical protein
MLRTTNAVFYYEYDSLVRGTSTALMDSSEHFLGLLYAYSTTVVHTEAQVQDTTVTVFHVGGGGIVATRESYETVMHNITSW